MPTNFSQKKFISQWNQVAYKLTKRRRGRVKWRLPVLKNGGTCCGLSFAIAEQVHLERESSFYQFYRLICTASPNAMVEWIENKKNDPKRQLAINYVLDMIYKIHILQKMQSDKIDKDLDFLNIMKWRNHQRIGSKFLGNVEDFVDARSIEKSICLYKPVEGESIIMSVFCKDGIQSAHAMIVYKKLGGWIAFDPNDGKPRAFKNERVLAQYCMNRINKTYIPLKIKSFRDNISNTNTILILLMFVLFPLGLLALFIIYFMEKRLLKKTQKVARKDLFFVMSNAFSSKFGYLVEQATRVNHIEENNNLMLYLQNDYLKKLTFFSNHDTHKNSSVPVAATKNPPQAILIL